MNARENAVINIILQLLSLLKIIWRYSLSTHPAQWPFGTRHRIVSEPKIDKKKKTNNKQTRNAQFRVVLYILCCVKSAVRN